MDFLQAPIHLRRLALIEKTADLTASGGNLPWFPAASRATVVMWLPLPTPVVFQIRNRELK